MKFAHSAAAASLAIAFTAMPTMTFAQSTCCEPTTKDWPQVAGNLGTWGYTALTQVDKSNVNKLAPAWMTHVSAEPVTTPVSGPGPWWRRARRCRRRPWR